MTPKRFSLVVSTALALATALVGATGVPTPVVAQDGNLRLSVQFIQADGFTDDDPAIRDVVAELRELFRFDGYRLLSEATMTAGVPGDDMTHLSQRIVPTVDDRFEVEVWLQGTEAAGLYRINLQLFDSRMEHYGDSGRDPGPAILEVTFNARVGQTVVVGSSRYDPEKPTLIVAFRVEQAPLE